MDSTRSTAPRTRIVAAALSVAIAGCGLGMPAALGWADDAATPEEAPAQATQAPDAAPAPSSSAWAVSLTADQIAADPAYGQNNGAAQESIGINFSATNDTASAAALADAVNALRSNALASDNALTAAAYQRAAESTLLNANVRPDGTLFTTVDSTGTGRVLAEILISAAPGTSLDAQDVLSSLSADQQALLTSDAYSGLGAAAVTDANGATHWAILLAANAPVDTDAAAPADGASTYYTAAAVANVQASAFTADISVEAGATQAAPVFATVVGDIANGPATAAFSGASVAVNGNAGTWNCSNPAVATVDVNGTVTGVAAGTCEVSMTNALSTAAGTQYLYNVSVTGDVAAGAVSLGDCTVAGIVGPYPYEGAPVTPGFTVIDPNNQTVDPSQYTYSYANNDAPGEASLTITAAEGSTVVSGSVTRDFEIDAPVAPEAPEATDPEQGGEGEQAPDGEQTPAEGEGQPAEGTPEESTPAEGEGQPAEGDASQPVEGDGEGEEVAPPASDPDAVDLKQAGYAIAAIADQLYSPDAPATPAVTVTKDGMELPATDENGAQNYVVSYRDNTEPGVATAVVTGAGAYKGALEATFVIQGTIAPENVAIAPDQNPTYNGQPQRPTLSVTFGPNATPLEPGTDYDVTYDNNVNAGTATATVTGKGAYTGTVTIEFAIAPQSIASYSISPIAPVTFTGAPIVPAVTVSNGTATLSSSDCTVAFTDNVNAGTAHFTVTGTGNYTGSLDGIFVINAAQINRTTITMPNMAYTGQALTPTPVSVTFGNVSLVAGTDYDIVGYSANTNVGDAKITLQGKGNFTGSVVADWKIVQQGSSNTGTTQTLPKTGDATSVVPIVVGAVVGVALIAAAVVLIVRRSHASKRNR